jgi:hemerythrin-like domain-containing protein
MGPAVEGAPQIDPASPALLDDPVGFFFAEHTRQRQLFNGLERLAAAERFDSGLATEVLAFLRGDLPLHKLYEEDLFSLMRLKSPPEDAIEEALSALSAEHAAADRLIGLVIAGLEAAVRSPRPIATQPGLSEAMADFVLSERRHLALENSIVLPLARRRLRAKDLAALSARMAARRAATPARGCGGR